MGDQGEDGRLQDKPEQERINYVRKLAGIDGPFQSPINLNLHDMHPLDLNKLCWFNYDIAPKKMKITNTGHTVIMSGKWYGVRPFIRNGPLHGSYVFSQLHFHWGENNMEGSEHTVDGKSFPLEMHVVHFKACYKTQDIALKEQDGLAIMVYFFQIQPDPNPELEDFVTSFQFIDKAHTSTRIKPIPMTSLMHTFDEDYFLYWGSVLTSSCAHLILWFVCREPIGISVGQMAKFRSLNDANNEPLVHNYREIQPLNNRSVFHVSPGKSLSHTMLHMPPSPSSNVSRWGQHSTRNSFEHCERYLSQNTRDSEQQPPASPPPNSHTRTLKNKLLAVARSTGNLLSNNSFCNKTDFQKSIRIFKNDNNPRSVKKFMSSEKIFEENHQNMKNFANSSTRTTNQQTTPVSPFHVYQMKKSKYSVCNKPTYTNNSEFSTRSSGSSHNSRTNSTFYSDNQPSINSRLSPTNLVKYDSAPFTCRQRKFPGQTKNELETQDDSKVFYNQQFIPKQMCKRRCKCKLTATNAADFMEKTCDHQPHEDVPCLTYIAKKQTRMVKQTESNNLLHQHSKCFKMTTSYNTLPRELPTCCSCSEVHKLSHHPNRTEHVCKETNVTRNVHNAKNNRVLNNFNSATGINKQPQLKLRNPLSVGDKLHINENNRNRKSNDFYLSAANKNSDRREKQDFHTHCKQTRIHSTHSNEGSYEMLHNESQKGHNTDKHSNEQLKHQPISVSFIAHPIIIFEKENGQEQTAGTEEMPTVDSAESSIQNIQDILEKYSQKVTSTAKVLHCHYRDSAHYLCSSISQMIDMSKKNEAQSANPINRDIPREENKVKHEIPQHLQESKPQHDVHVSSNGIENNFPNLVPIKDRNTENDYNYFNENNPMIPHSFSYDEYGQLSVVKKGTMKNLHERSVSHNRKNSLNTVTKPSKSASNFLGYCNGPRCRRLVPTP